jgi:hypothetical protein
MYIGLTVKYPLFFSGLMKIVFYGQIFEKKIFTLNFTKILPVGAKLFRANDGRMDGQGEASSRVSQICESA